MLADEQDISEPENITKYFEMLYHFRGESLDKKRLMDEFKNKNYNFAKVGKEFNLIEENTKTIFINQEPEADEILHQLIYQGFTRTAMRKAGQYCINVLEGEFEKLEGMGMIRLVSEDIQDFYELVNTEQYTSDMGLNLNLDNGMAIFC